MSRMLRTLHVETGMHILGGPMQVLYLVKGIRERGHEALLVLPKGSAICEHARTLGLDVAEIPFRGDLDLTLIPRLCRLVRTHKPDVVHLHSRRGADLLGGIAARRSRVPAVILSRRVDNPVKRGMLSRLKYGRLCDHIIAISHGIVRALIEGGVDPQKITCVHSATDVKAYQKSGREDEVRSELGIGPEELVVAIAAQLIERKGHRFLFQAVPEILRSSPNTKFLILGEGALESGLKGLASELGIAEHTIFAGFRNDMPDILSIVDVLVHPATMEGLGVAILQAMAAGIPVVASGVGGIPEAVRDGVNGFLVPPRDSEAIAAGVMRLLNDPHLRRDFGEAGRLIAEEEFSVEAMVKGVLEVYHRVLGTESPA